jgi:hypothetical protein
VNFVCKRELTSEFGVTDTAALPFIVVLDRYFDVKDHPGIFKFCPDAGS